MIASDIINRVKRELVETVAAFYSDAELLQLLNKAERVMLGDARLLEEDIDLDLVQGQMSYPLPTSWVGESAIFIEDDSNPAKPVWKRLRMTNLEKASQENSNLLSTDVDEQGIPNKCWLWGNEIYFHPVPDDTYKIRMFFKSKPVEIINVTDDINLDDSLADGLEAYMLWKCWKKEKEPELALEAKAEFDAWVLKARRFLKKKAGDRRHQIDIESSTGFTGGSWIE